MPKIQFKRKKSTGIGTNKLSAGEPLYNLQDKKLYIGGNAAEDETPSKHLTEVGVSTAGKVSIGAATNNDFTITAGNGIDITGNATNRTIKVDIESAYKPSEATSADKLKTGRTITLSGAVTGSTTFDGTEDKTISTSYAVNDSKSANKIVRYISTDSSGKLTTTKGTLTAGDNITISESGNNLTISSDTQLETLTSASNEIAFSINGREYRKSIAVEGVGMSVDSADKWTTGRKITLAGDLSGNVTIDGSADVTLTATVKDDSHGHNISATGTDGLMDVTATGGTNSVDVAVAPYTSQQSKASFDSSSTAPKLTTRLNYNGDLYATNMYGNNSSGTPTKVVLTDDSRLSDSRTPKSHTHGNITNGGIVGDATRVVVTDANSKITTSSITTTKLGYLTDVTSNIQAQINGKAPTSHASANTTYGVSSADNYGHSKASSTSPKMSGTAAVGTETAAFARGDHVHPTDTSRASSSHTHGNITNDGKLSQSSRAVITDSNGKITISEVTATEIGYLDGVTSSVQTQLDGKATSTHKHKVSSTVTSEAPSATVACVNITVADGVLNVESVTAAGDAHTHSVTITDAETGTPV